MHHTSHICVRYLQAKNDNLNIAPFIKKIWILENPSSLNMGNTGVLVGDGRFELAIVKGNGYRTIRNNNTILIKEGIYLGGQMNQPLDLEILPETHITFIKLEPWTVGFLSGFNFVESLNETVPFNEINPQMHNKLISSIKYRDNEKIIHVLNQELTDLSRATTDWQLIQHCCTIFDNEYSEFSIAKNRILSDTNLSARTIENKFARNIGLSPQQYSSGIRFRKFTEDLKNTSSTPLTTLALKHGFYDQAHLNRLFKKYWGFSPKKFLLNKTFITDYKEPFRYYTI